MKRNILRRTSRNLFTSHYFGEPSRSNTRDIFSEVDEHCQLGANLRNRSKGCARIAGARQKLPSKTQVRARRDRQELGEALDDAQDDRFEP